MAAVEDYVGVEPEGLRLLAASLDAAEDDVRYADSRIQALLDEAGEGDPTCGALSAICSDLNEASADLRRRAAIAEQAPTPMCTMPWWDPLRRAGLASWNNAWSFGHGTVDSFAQGGSTIWQLLPMHDEWRQEWVDLRTGLDAARANPGDALYALAGLDALDEEGYSYWAGGVVPDAVLSVFGGLGVANRSMNTAEAIGDVADAADKASKLERLGGLALAATRRGIVEGDGALRPVRLGLRLDIEAEAKADMLALDVAVPGHHAAKHGPETTNDQQLRRALTGTNPDGTSGYPVNASRFLRWQDQREAVRRATALRDKERRIVIPFDHIIGEGFMKDTGEYRQTMAATVRFTADGRPYTSFPELKDGF